jgi:cytochrome c-type biogenesis protein CcmH
MNVQLLFIALAAALAIGVVLLLVPVLWRGPKTSNVARSAVNAAVLRDQLAELERDRISGMLSAADHEQAKQELQRRVLDEAKPDTATGTAQTASKRTAITLALFLPLAAVAAYLVLGNPAALSPQALRPPQITKADIDAMVASLAEKLRRNPDDPKGWVMLGRSYRILGRHEDAARAFANGSAVVDIDPQLLTEYAETLAIARGGVLLGEPARLVERALKLDPQYPLALAMAGSAAFERKDHEAAIDYWTRLQIQMPPDSEEARAVTEGIKKARSAQAQKDPATP